MKFTHDSILLVTNQDHFDKLERMYHNHPLNSVFSAKLDISMRSATLCIPIAKHLFHAAKAAHGSVYFKALDDASFFAANSIVEDVFMLTKTFTIDFLRPISAGEMIARAKVVEETKKKIKTVAELYNSDDELIGKGEGIFVRSKIALRSDLGYQ